MTSDGSDWLNGNIPLHLYLSVPTHISKKYQQPTNTSLYTSHVNEQPFLLWHSNTRGPGQTASYYCLRELLVTPTQKRTWQITPIIKHSLL